MTGTRVPLDRGDWLPPTALALAAVAEILAFDEIPQAVSAATMVIACALLVGRRHHPLILATASGLVILLSTHLGVPDEPLTMPLLILFACCFALGRYVESWWGIAGVVTLDLTLHWLYGVTIPPLEDWLWAGVLTFGPYVFGRLVLRHARLNALLAVQARQLVEEQRHVADRAVAAERRRIARELHDVIAHSLSVMVVQAGSARDLLATDPDRVGPALDEIQRAGRSALGETGRLLGLLREEANDDLEPQPTAADLPRLVESFGSAGLQATLTMDGPTEGLPAGVDLSVFRIVEEGLTNALKHAPGGAVAVTYSRSTNSVQVDLANATSNGSRAMVSSGQGLVGMRERVAIFGGSLDATPTLDGGFIVRALLPVPDQA